MFYNGMLDNFSRTQKVSYYLEERAPQNSRKYTSNVAFSNVDILDWEIVLKTFCQLLFVKYLIM